MFCILIEVVITYITGGYLDKISSFNTQHTFRKVDLALIAKQDSFTILQLHGIDKITLLNWNLLQSTLLKLLIFSHDYVFFSD